MSVYYGKTIEEAVEEGLKELNLTKETAEITVLEEPTKGGLFGIGAKKAKVEITEKKREEKPVLGENVVSDGMRAVEFIDGLFDKMNVVAKCTLVEEDEKVVIDLIAENSSPLIGYRGEVLDAIQTLAGAVANIGRDDYRRVVVDCEGYRKKREETLVALANKLAAKAVRTGRKVTLEPMNPYERRILHSTLAESTEVKTQSEGKEPNRYVAIIPNNLKPYSGKGKDGYKGDRGGRNGGTKRYNKDGRDRREHSDAPRQPRPKTSGFGTFLGNSLKENKPDEE